MVVVVAVRLGGVVIVIDVGDGHRRHGASRPGPRRQVAASCLPVEVRLLLDAGRVDVHESAGQRKEFGQHCGLHLPAAESDESRVMLGDVRKRESGNQTS